MSTGGWLYTLLGRLVVDDPICRSQEGLDDCCAFCYASADRRCDTSHHEPGQTYQGRCLTPITVHDADCPWVKGVHVLHRKLGPHNRVTGDPF